jgi:Domain of unknown function (DUF6487)
MTSPSVTCPKCNGRMVRGYVLDNTYGMRLVGHWSAGEPKKSFWTGTKPPENEQIPIGTFRCAACGFLESWAQSGFEAM